MSDASSDIALDDVDSNNFALNDVDLYHFDLDNVAPYEEPDRNEIDRAFGPEPECLECHKCKCSLAPDQFSNDLPILICDGCYDIENVDDAIEESTGLVYCCHICIQPFEPSRATCKRCEHHFCERCPTFSVTVENPLPVDPETEQNELGKSLQESARRTTKGRERSAEYIPPITPQVEVQSEATLTVVCHECYTSFETGSSTCRVCRHKRCQQCHNYRDRLGAYAEYMISLGTPRESRLRSTVLADEDTDYNVRTGLGALPWVTLDQLPDDLSMLHPRDALRLQDAGGTSTKSDAGSSSVPQDFRWGPDWEEFFKVN